MAGWLAARLLDIIKAASQSSQSAHFYYNEICKMAGLICEFPGNWGGSLLKANLYPKKVEIFNALSLAKYL